MMAEGGPRPICRAAVVVPILPRHDAIAQAAVDTWRLLNSLPGTQATLLTTGSDRPEVPAEIAGGVGELLVSQAFVAADLIVYHFGLHNPIFDALLVGNGHARQVVRFHNVTPARFLRPDDGRLVQRSLDQLWNFQHADAIWADSQANRDALLEQGLLHPSAEIIPLVVDAPARARLSAKGAGTVEILFLGRFVQSKGVLDLVQALADVAGRGSPSFHLQLAGNQAFSDADYVQAVRRSSDALGGKVEFLGAVDDARRDELLHAAHILAIPSYHEGFCKPVVEGMRAGCIPLGYASSNLPNICAGLGRLVPQGDVAALADALSELIGDVMAIMQGQEGRCLRLDRGATSVAELAGLVGEYVLRFEFDAVRALTLDSVRRLLPQSGNSRRLSVMREALPFINVRPDDEMRERERSSLNRLPDLSDWEAGGRLSTVMRDLNETVSIHRKAWEYAMCIHGLDALGVVRPEAVGLAVGAGSERPLYYYANTIKRMVATDLYDSEAHEGTPLMLTIPERFAPFPYRRDRLEVLRMPGDQLDFPEASFDFVFCLSSIEHFGSRETQRRSLDEMARVLKRGGVACIITELILTDHRDREYFRWEEIEEVFLRHPLLRLDGGDPDLSISESLLAFPVDLSQVTRPLAPALARRLNRSPHIVLKRGDMLWTSFSMFLRRIGEGQQEKVVQGQSEQVLGDPKPLLPRISCDLNRLTSSTG